MSGFLQVEVLSLTWELHCRASLLAVYAPQALLLALAVKLRVSKSGSLGGPSLRPPAYAPRHLRSDRAAGFLGSCFPTAPGSKARRFNSLSSLC